MRTHTPVQQFSAQCLQTKTKAITLDWLYNHKGHSEFSLQSKLKVITCSVRKCMKTHNWFWFYFLFAERVAQDSWANQFKSKLLNQSIKSVTFDTQVKIALYCTTCTDLCCNAYMYMYMYVTSQILLLNVPVIKEVDFTMKGIRQIN